MIQTWHFQLSEPSSPLQVFQSFFNSLSAKERKELQSRMTRNGT